MEINIEILKYPNNLKRCFDVRYEVFVEEQKFDKSIEIDDIDNEAYHVLLNIDNKPVATARFFLNKNYWKIGRVCVLKEYRSLKLGSNVMSSIEEHLKKLNVSKVWLTSQLQAVKFYEKNGYICDGEIFLEEDCEHIKMYKII